MVNPTLQEFSESCSEEFERQYKILFSNNTFSEDNLRNNFSSEFSKIQKKMFMLHQEVNDLKFLFDINDKRYYVDLCFYLQCKVKYYRYEGFINTSLLNTIKDDLERMMMLIV